MLKHIGSSNNLTVEDPTIYPPDAETPPRLIARVARILLWTFGVPAVFILALYIKLLFGPMPLPFVIAQAEAGARAQLPANISVDFGSAGLAIEGGILPVMQFSPVSITDSDTGTTVKMDALDIGFSPLPAIVGQPAVSVTLVRPKLQIVQDLFGPRMAGFELVDNPDGDDATIWVLDGDKSVPSVRISADGLDISGATPPAAGQKFRSDNDWLKFNLQAMADAIVSFEEQASAGKLSRLRVRGGVLEMHDLVAGVFRRFSDVRFDISPAGSNGEMKGRFGAMLAGRNISGRFQRSRNAAGDAVLNTQVKNLDFASLLPFIDDADGVIALKGTGDMDLEVLFDGRTGAVSGGVFDVDLSGASLRIQDDLFPIATENVSIVWDPLGSKFTVDDARIKVGQSLGTLSGIFVMGLDETFGPTISMSIEGRNVLIHPYDMAAPLEPFSEVAFSGWSAPLYGAVGIDQMVIRRNDMLLRAKGRADMVRSGIGMEMEIGGQGATADDLKRLWPYFISSDGRDWFVRNVSKGMVEEASMKLNFPVGSLAVGDEQKPVPPGALEIDIVGRDVVFRPVETFAPVAVEGLTRIRVRDAKTTASLDGATIVSDEGRVTISDGAFIIDTATPGTSVFEISGTVGGNIPALVAVIKEQLPESLESFDVPIDLEALDGIIDGSVVTTIVMGDNDEVKSLDYAINGNVANFTSSSPIGGYPIGNGQISFAVSPQGYNIGGTAEVSGVATSIGVVGTLEEDDPEIVISTEISVDDLKEFGFDASDFLSGTLKLAARPLPDGSLQVRADITNASVVVADLGITKAKGVAGELKAVVHPDEEGQKFRVDEIELAFADVDIKGQLTFDVEAGLESAEFSTFALSAGDDARLQVIPQEGGIQLVLQGEQLDLKPMLKRFFALDQVSSGGPQSTQFGDSLSLDVKLNQAIGFYRTIAFNLDLHMELHGEDLRNVSMQAQFAEGRSVSITTNPTQNGRTLSVAFNDAGTLLRFLNVYPRLLGGDGSMTMAKNTGQDIDIGHLSLRNFSLVDEEKVAEILGNHRDSRSLVANENRINFNAANIEFIRRSDRIEVVDAVLDGDSVGGTMRGFIYTKRQEYDLAGTYVPLFGLNSIFQKLPLLGPLLGGRDGEGLVGVTFAVRGALDSPQFLINPASILLPGVFRSLMEFRAKEAPREQ